MVLVYVDTLIVDVLHLRDRFMGVYDGAAALYGAWNDLRVYHKKVIGVGRLLYMNITIKIESWK